ncbi:MAG: hypothetical protein F6K19_16510 [Cyanothece sp. SIO1E1]|nr:hypothetical protein [Cyanothece sp. SIO1E1]
MAGDCQVFVRNNALEYQVEPKKSTIADIPWRIPLDDIVIIALWDKMVGDDDTTFLIFIDKHLRVFPMRWPFGMNYKEKPNPFIVLLAERFAITEFETHYKKATICYPEKLKGKYLYKTPLSYRLKRAFAVVHPALGIVSEDIIAQL